VVHVVNCGSQWPTLKHTNYADWVVLMRIQLQVHGLWEALKEGDYDEHGDRAALSALLHAVPPELVHILAAKDNAKAVWHTSKTMLVGAERLRGAKA
jgi:creatinine amidohydrolase/Fe(II)-dependent formamide hydrolase-like protein